MTTITIAPPNTRTGSNRVLANAKLLVANPWTTLILPSIILGIIFVANWCIWWLISANAGPEAMRSASQGMAWSGAGFYLFVYMMVVAIQAVNASFPLALGWGSTRRDFSLGAAITWVGLTLVYATAFTILGVVEEATDGWGLGGVMFTAIYFGDGPWYTRFLVCIALLLFFFFVGSALAAAYVRWKANGLYVFFVALGVLVIGGAAILTFANGWPWFGDVLSGFGFTGIVIGSLPVSAIAGVIGWLILRKATPRS